MVNGYNPPMIKIFTNKISGLIKDKHFNEIFENSVIVFLSRVIGVLIGLAANFVIAHYYGADLLGVVAVLSSFIAFSSLFITIGFETSLLRLIPEQLKINNYNSAKSVFKKSVLIVAFFGVFVSIILWFFTPFISTSIYSQPDILKWFYIAVCLLFIFNISKIISSAVRGFGEIRLFSLMNILQPFTNIFILVLLTIYFNDINSPIYAYFISIILVFAFSIIIITSILKKGNDFENKTNHSAMDLIKISWPMFITSGMWIAIGQIDIVMISALIDAKHVGIYTVAMKIGLLNNFILTSINMVLGPKISELYFGNEMDALSAIVKKTTKLTFFLTAPIIFFTIIIGKFVLMFFGKEFIIGYTALIIISLGQLVNVSCGSVGYFMNMTGHQNEFNKIVIFGAVINVVSNFLLIPRFGINGAAFASFFSTIIWNISATFYIKKKFGFYIGYNPIFGRKRVEIK